MECRPPIHGGATHDAGPQGHWRSDEMTWLRASDMTGQSADGSGPGYIYNARDLTNISPEKPNLDRWLYI